MRASFFFALAIFLFTGCLVQATPTPIEIQQLPATWTPAPTETSTPRPPTATLVIQRTPGPLPTRDPNVRVLPNAPRNGIGIWAQVTQDDAEISETLLTRANVIVTDGAVNLARSNAFRLLAISEPSLSLNENVLAGYQGVVLQAPSEDLPALRESIKPRVALVTVPFSDTGKMESVIREVDGFQLENFLRAPNDASDAFLAEAEWRAQLELLASLSSNSNQMLLTMTRFTPPKGDEEISAQQWLEYALASFLVGVNGTRTFFGFESAASPQVMDSPLYHLDIGNPLTGVVRQNNVYQRRFTRGLVLANPSDNTHAFTLSRNYLDVNGARLDQVEMLPHTGMILLNLE